MFPNRSQSGIATYARQLGAHRGPGPFLNAVPAVFAEGVTANTMVTYGFPLVQSDQRESPVLISASRSRDYNVASCHLPIWLLDLEKFDLPALR
jgi:hypothetical protein